jgi:predicted lipoprotein with Yx(FWY)xxD motif
MRKNSQKGFSPVEILLFVVIIGLVAFVVWFVFHSKNNADNTLNGAASTQIASPQKSSKTTTKTSTTAQVVSTKTDSKGVQYLADANGKTLYIYGSDTANTSNCTGTCLATWPAYKATSTSATLPTNVGTITRTDGGVQYTYKKMPLYYYVGDTSAGQITGDGVNGFSVAKP